MQMVVELAFQVLCCYHRIYRARMEHPAVDVSVKLERARIAVELRVFRRLNAARLVVATVNHQAALQLLQGPVDGDNLVVGLCVEAQRVHLVHLDGEVLVGKQAVLGEKLKHARQNAARELEIAILLEYDTVVVGHDDHMLAVAQRDGRVVDAVHLAGNTENK